MISQPANAIRRCFAIAVVATLMTGCASQAPESSGKSQTRPAAGVPTTQTYRTSLGARVAAIALDQVGAPYRYGGSGPPGFDCSGLVQYSYASVGKSLPRTTTALWNATAAVDRAGIRVGDLLFFNIDGKMSHVGLYVGNGRFVHAPSTGKVVSVESLGSAYYSKAFVRAGRPR